MISESLISFMINSDNEISDSEIISTGIPYTELQYLMIELASRYCVPVGCAARGVYTRVPARGSLTGPRLLTY